MPDDEMFEEDIPEVADEAAEGEPEGPAPEDIGPAEAEDAGPGTDVVDGPEGDAPESDSGDSGAPAVAPSVTGSFGDGIPGNRDEYGFQNRNVWTM